MTYPQIGPLPGDDAHSRRHWLARAGYIAVAALAIVGIVYALAGTVGTTDAQRTPGGRDSRTPLGVGLSAIVQTEAKAVVQVRIRSVAADFSGFTVTVAGLPSGEAGSWSAVLDDGSEIPLVATLGEDSLVSVVIAGAPAGRTVEEARLDPDESAGDIYFDLAE